MHRRQSLVRGVIADVVIPYSSDEEPDFDRLASEIKVLEGSGVHAFCVGGVLSGAIGATPDQLSSLCAAVRRSSGKPVFAIVFPDASPEGYEMVRAVDEAGAEAIFVGQPHYLAQPGVEGLEEMFAGLRELTDRPVLVADCLPGSLLGVASIRKLVEKGLVDGVLEAADMHVLVDLLCLQLEVPVYSSIEDLHYPALVLGAQGVISNLASVFPCECVDMYDAMQEGGHLEARRLHEQLVRLWRALSTGSEREARLRLALALRGRPVGPARSPYGKLPRLASQQISAILEKEGALTQAR